MSMIPAITVPEISPHFQGDRIEQVVDQPRFQNRVRNKVIPFYLITKTSRVNVAKADALIQEFIEEIKQKSARFLHIESWYFVQHFITAAEKIFECQPDSISVELTSAQSIFLFSQIGVRKVYLEIFFDEHSGRFSKAVLNIFAHKQQQLSLSGNLSYVLRELNYYFNPAVSFAEDSPYTAYELSGSADTTFAF